MFNTHFSGFSPPFTVTNFRYLLPSMKTALKKHSKLNIIFAAGYNPNHGHDLHTGGTNEIDAWNLVYDTYNHYLQQEIEKVGHERLVFMKLPQKITFSPLGFKLLSDQCHIDFAKDAAEYGATRNDVNKWYLNSILNYLCEPSKMGDGDFTRGKSPENTCC